MTVHSHSGLKGNEIADSEAKRFAQKPQNRAPETDLFGRIGKTAKR